MKGVHWEVVNSISKSKKSQNLVCNLAKHFRVYIWSCDLVPNCPHEKKAEVPSYPPKKHCKIRWVTSDKYEFN